jgi:hypothetical protein
VAPPAFESRQTELEKQIPSPPQVVPHEDRNGEQLGTGAHAPDGSQVEAFE